MSRQDIESSRSLPPRAPPHPVTYGSLEEQLRAEFVKNGILTKEQLKQADDYRSELGGSLEEAIYATRPRPEDELLEAFGKITRIPTINSAKLASIQPSQPALDLIDYASAMELDLVPLAIKSGGQLVVAMREPSREAYLARIQKLIGSRGLVTVQAGPEALIATRERLYGQRNSQTQWLEQDERTSGAFTAKPPSSGDEKSSAPNVPAFENLVEGLGPPPAGPQKPPNASPPRPPTASPQLFVAHPVEPPPLPSHRPGSSAEHRPPPPPSPARAPRSSVSKPAAPSPHLFTAHPIEPPPLPSQRAGSTHETPVSPAPTLSKPIAVRLPVAMPAAPSPALFVAQPVEPAPAPPPVAAVEVPPATSPSALPPRITGAAPKATVSTGVYERLLEHLWYTLKNGSELRTVMTTMCDVALRLGANSSADIHLAGSTLFVANSVARCDISERAPEPVLRELIGEQDWPRIVPCFIAWQIFPSTVPQTPITKAFCLVLSFIEHVDFPLPHGVHLNAKLRSFRAEKLFAESDYDALQESLTASSTPR